MNEWGRFLHRVRLILQIVTMRSVVGREPNLINRLLFYVVGNSLLFQISGLSGKCYLLWRIFICSLQTSQDSYQMANTGFILPKLIEGMQRTMKHTCGHHQLAPWASMLIGARQVAAYLISNHFLCFCLLSKYDCSYLIRSLHWRERMRR